jgi:hypothetical protein
MRRRHRPLLVVAPAALIMCLSAAAVSATPQLLSEAKKQGLPAQNCQYCHVSKAPQKSSYKPDDLNDRGQWLMMEKDKQRGNEINADWLKQYPGGKDQK